MSFVRIPVIASIFATLFIIQEALLNRINFFIGGFSLYLAWFLVWTLFEDRSNALAVGFIAGLIADLSPTLDAPFGLWIFVFTVTAYLMSTNVRTALDTELSPVVLTGVAVIGSTITLIFYALTGAILGVEIGSFSSIAKELIGNALWCLVLSPLYVPVVHGLFKLSLTARSR